MFDKFGASGDEEGGFVITGVVAAGGRAGFGQDHRLHVDGVAPANFVESLAVAPPTALVAFVEHHFEAEFGSAFAEGQG